MRGHVAVDVTCTLRNDAAEIGRVAAELDHVFARAGLEDEMVADLQVALDEVLSNIVNYAYPENDAHEIGIRLRVLPRRVIVDVTDAGGAFDPLKVPAPVADSRLEDHRIGGLGIHFVRNLMDRVEYARRGGYNRLRLVKDRHKPG